jgi:hypothetical protein
LARLPRPCQDARRGARRRSEISGGPCEVAITDRWKFDRCAPVFKGRPIPSKGCGRFIVSSVSTLGALASDTLAPQIDPGISGDLNRAGLPTTRSSSR